jgi:hypothetical protein
MFDSTIALLRSSNPAAAFAALKDELFEAVQRDPELAKAFESLKKFRIEFTTTREDARQLADLQRQGADQLGIKVGILPLAIGPGVAFMYDAAIEALRSNNGPIEPNIFTARSMRVAERLFDVVFEKTGACSVTALKRALADGDYADRLRNRAAELRWLGQGWLALDNPIGPCEWCTIAVKDATGVETITCPTQKQCEEAAPAFWLLIIIFLLMPLLKWLFD